MQARLYKFVSVLLSLLLALPLVLGLLASPRTVLAAETPELKRALLATVEIVVPIDGKKDQAAGGSGSVLTSDGYILTNRHVVVDVDGTGELFNRDGQAAIAINNANNLHSLPTFTYLAQVVRDDADLDLAILKIVKPLNKKGNLPANLGLVTMPLGESAKVEFDDSVRCLGYPGIGGDSVTFTRGSISGFLDQAEDGTPAWFKSDAQVNHGNSGGAAIDDKGNMIGIPTRISTDPEAAGKISLIRPVDLAKPLIKAALHAVDPVPQNNKTPGAANIGDISFTDVVSKQGQPGKARTQFDPGLKALYGLFDYAGFEDGQSFTYTWLKDGKKLLSDSVDWSNGAEGSSYVSLTAAKGLVAGTYQVNLSLDGEQLQTAKVLIGKPARPQAKAPKFGAITFAEDVDEQDEPVKPHSAGEAFASGAPSVYAFFDYSNIPEGTPYSYAWYCDGEEMLARERQWEASDAAGNYWLQVNNGDGLPDGQWRLELSIDGKAAVEGEFVIGGNAQPADEGVQVTGSIIDADTRRPLPGAIFLVLVPGTDVDEFLDNLDDSLIYAQGSADESGSFSLDRLLERDQTYVIVAGTEKYQPVVEEAFKITQDTEFALGSDRPSPEALTLPAAPTLALRPTMSGAGQSCHPPPPLISYNAENGLMEGSTSQRTSREPAFQESVAEKS